MSSDIRDIRQLQQQAWDAWRHDHKRHALARIMARFDDDTASMLAKFCNPVINPLRRVARLLAVTYSQPVYRTSGDPAIDRAVRQHAPALDAALAEAERIMQATGDAIVVAYWTGSRVGLRVLPPHTVDVALDESGDVQYYQIAGVQYRADGSWSPPGGAPVRTYEACTVAWYRLSPHGQDTWSVQAVADLVSGTIEVAVAEAINAVSDYLRSYRQAYLQDTATPAQARRIADATRIGPDVILEHQIGTVELADPDNQHYQVLRRRVADLAASRGISETAYYAGGDAIVGPELRKIWRESTQYTRVPETDVLRAIVSVLVHAGVLPAGATAAQWAVDYREPTPDESSPLRALDVLEAGIRLGVDSPVDWLLRTQRDVVTRDDAIARLARNAEDRARVVVLMRELNLPADQRTYDVPPSPQDNGARGPAIAPPGLQV